ncbi:cell division protein ZapB [candidate division KSB1 bacterium]|nr:cell division protein ZapB [candidate division KSB1 bacterium]
MDENQLDVLDDKINKAIEIINSLQAENNRLKDQNQELINKLGEYDELLKKLTHENEDLKTTAGQSNIKDNKQEIIKQKLETILLKLDNLQQVFSI